MNVLTPLAALAFAFGAEAFTAQTEGFETITAGQGVGAAQKFVYVAPEAGVTDASVVTQYNNDAPDDTVLAEEPPSPFTSSGNNYLKLSTEDGTLLRSINALNEGAVGTPAEIPAEGITIDTMMQFTATDSADRPVPGENDKFTMWLDKDGEDVKLMVCGGKFSYADSANKLTRASGYAMYSLDADIEVGSWHRVTIMAIANANSESTEQEAIAVPAFQIFIDGSATVATRVLLEDGDTGDGIFTNDGDTSDAEVDERLAGANPAFIPSLSEDATLAAVGFAGEGKIDDLVINDNSVVPVNFSITPPEGCTVDTEHLPAGVTYDSVSGTFTAENAGDYTFTFVAADGKLFADGTKIATGTISVTSDVSEYTATLEKAIANAMMSITKDSVKTEYLTLFDAFDAATDGDTIVFEDNFAGVIQTNSVAEKRFINGVTIDLNGKTWTFQGGDNERMCEISWSNNVTFVNGAITVAADTTQAIAFYSYSEMLEFRNVALDFSNLAMIDDPAGDPRKNIAIVSQNGSVKFSGTTTVTLAENQRLVTMLDRAQTKYIPGTLTIDVDGTIPGDILLYSACGFDVGDDTVLSGDVYTGAANFSAFEASGVVKAPFEAIAQLTVPATGSASVNTYMGKFYATLAEAKAAAQAGYTIALLKDGLDIAGTYATDITIDCNGHKIADNAKKTISVSDGADFKLANGEFGANAYTIAGTAGKVEVVNMTGNTFVSGQLLSITATAADGVFVTGCSLENATTSMLSLDNANTAFYVYNNTFGKKGVANPANISHAGRPQLQVCKVKSIAIEGNTFKDNTDADYATDYAGKLTDDRTAGLAGAAIGIHAGYYSNTPNAPIVVNGNDFSDVSYVVGLDCEDFDNVPFAVPGLVFNANTVGSASLTSGVYKYANNVLDYTGKYSTADRLALPSGVTTCYAWATGDNAATPFYVNTAYAADLASAVADDVVIALPGADLSSLGETLQLNADASFANKWTVAVKSQGTNPGEETGVTYDNAEAATNACAGVTVLATDAVKAALTTAGVAEADYLAMFTGKVVDKGEGTFAVVVGLTTAAEEDLQAQANADAAEVLEDEVTITTTPGFYYSLKQGTTLDNMVEGERTLATGTTLTLTPDKTGSAGFYKVLINIVPKAE